MVTWNASIASEVPPPVSEPLQYQEPDGLAIHAARRVGEQSRASSRPRRDQCSSRGGEHSEDYPCPAGEGEDVQPAGDRACESDQAVVPQPETRPFFETLSRQVPDEMTRRRKQRGSVSLPRHDSAGTEPIDIAPVPPRRLSGKSQRVSAQVPRVRKLTPDRIAAIRAQAGSKSLRSLAADFQVSHETIRAVVRQKAPA